jgi:hypothetical protein
VRSALRRARRCTPRSRPGCPARLASAEPAGNDRRRTRRSRTRLAS